MHLAHELTRVVQEKPVLYAGRVTSARVGYGLAAAAEAWCDHKGLSWMAVPPAKIKKHATGSGNATKDMMFEAARVLWLNVMDHNEADALWLLDLVMNGDKVKVGG